MCTLSFYCNLQISYFYLFSDKADFTYTVAFGNGFRQFQLAAKAFGNTAVTAHGMVAHTLNFFITAALFLPCFHQRTVVKIDIQMVIIAAQNFHFKNQLRRFAE